MKSSRQFLALILFFVSAVALAEPKKVAAPIEELDIAFLGAGGIMSGTLGTMLKELDPNLKMGMFERLPILAGESSGGWNNAGTGHAGLAELNYTPEVDGVIETDKAVHVAEQFELSKQYWAHLAAKGYLGNPKAFIHPVPHMSLVRGEEDVAYLRKRFEALKGNPLFTGMEYSEDPNVLKQWMGPVMEGKNLSAKMAATHSTLGTDVDFGSLTTQMVKHLERTGTPIHLQHDIRNLTRQPDGTWLIDMYDMKNKTMKQVKAKKVFIGAGGGALPLLQKSGIPEAKGYGAFPISGQFLVCKNPALAEAFNAKVYGKADVGAPPMSVPHLDTRIIDGKRHLIFGPFAGFTTKFLKNGSYADLFKSLKLDNLYPMVSVGAKNIPLSKYLVEQVMLTHKDHMRELQKFLPGAKANEWQLIEGGAGVRAQIIKPSPKGGGELQFGTEVITSADGSLSGLLGASPGASTSVAIMLEVLQEMYGDKMKGEWKAKLEEMVPTYGKELSDNPELVRKVRAASHAALRLNDSSPSSCRDELPQLVPRAQ